MLKVALSTIILTLYSVPLMSWPYKNEILDVCHKMFCIFSVPHANLYVLINPVKLMVDYLTVLWSNYFLLNLAQSMVSLYIKYKL